MRWMIVLPVLGLILSACEPLAVTPGTQPSEQASGEFRELTPEEAVNIFAEVLTSVEPVAERECRRSGRNVNCDFLIAVDPNPRAPPNAFQSEDEQGRPILTFTASLIGSVRNADELAFVMGHEAAHHIENHLYRQRVNAESAAEVFAELATLTGGGERDVASAKELGAAVGARAYSKNFELEADKLGTVITYRAGYDPLRGAEFFMRIPDPGDRFLASHPQNADRLETVRQTVKSLGG